MIIIVRLGLMSLFGGCDAITTLVKGKKFQTMVGGSHYESSNFKSCLTLTKCVGW